VVEEQRSLTLLALRLKTEVAAVVVAPFRETSELLEQANQVREITEELMRSVWVGVEAGVRVWLALMRELV
jgi:hypothetical protein